MPIAQGTISLLLDGNDAGNSGSPTGSIYFDVAADQLGLLDKAVIKWKASNATKIELKIEVGSIDPRYQQTVYFITEEVLPIIDVTNLSLRGYEVVFHRTLATKLTLIVSNDFGDSFSSEPIYIKRAYSDTQTVGKIFNETDGFSVSREDGTFNQIKGTILLIADENFNSSLISSVELLYKNENTLSWIPIKLSFDQTSLFDIKDSGGNITGYKIVFTKLSVSVPNIGSALFFLVKIKTSVGEFYSKQTFLFFDALNPTNITTPDASSPSLEVVQQKPAQLKYEITAIISEAYYQAEDATSLFNNIASSKENNFNHAFLDTDKFKGKVYSSFGNTLNVGDGFFEGFYYEATPENSSSDNFRGHFYPACVSEILPCINIIKGADGKTSDVILFWKIIDDFPNYKFFNNSINIITNELIVSVKYFDGSVYRTVLSNASLQFAGPLTNYNDSENKFTLRLSRAEVDKTGYLSLFDKITAQDNKTNNLKIVVESHKVTCISPYRSVDYSFSKLLLPPKWKYIVYDEFISFSSRNTNDNTIAISFGDLALRGIQIPDRGFKYFDKIKNFKYYYFDSNGSGESTQTTKVLYKLSSTAKAFYLDPVRSGTVSYVELPFKPDDVFLIPPSVSMPEPNLDPNGKKAEAEITLNEYGKISGVKVIDPGYGYSTFKTKQDQRTQLFVDLTPIIKSSYKIFGTNLNVNKQTLVPVNNSFSNLKASVFGGKLLSEVGGNDAALNSEQSQILQDYLSRNNIIDSNANIPDEDSDKSSYPYINKNPSSDNETSIEILDPDWFAISKLYVAKTLSPVDEVRIYTETTDASASEIEDSELSSNITSSFSSIDVASPDVNNSNNVSVPKTAQTFTLNYLNVYTDNSPAAFLYNPRYTAPSFTLMPLSMRSDGSPAYGTLPNMITRAGSFFNRMVMGINSLNEVRLILPTVWAVNSVSFSNSYYRIDDIANKNQLLEFSTEGARVSYASESSYFIPSNSGFSVSASRSVGRSYLESQNVPDQLDTGAGTYIISTEDGSSIRFLAMIHPWMEKAFPMDYIKKFTNKYFGIYRKDNYSCTFTEPFKENGVAFIACPGVFGDLYPRTVPPTTSIPSSKYSTTSKFQFFKEGTISESPSGNAFSLSLPNGRVNGIPVFCSESCGTSSTTSLDFRYSNLYPSIILVV